jgi:hypothetical protein
MHGFRPKRSCSDVAATIVTAVESGFQSAPSLPTIVVCLDLQSAYDSVDKNALLLKMRRLKVSDVVVRWVRCFLSARAFKVRVDNNLFSRLRRIRAGLPQGSPLSPVLFNYFTSDLILCKKSPGPSPVLCTYADDITIIVTGPITEATRTMQNAVKYVQRWCSDWGMTLAPDKSEAILFSLNQSRTLNHDHHRVISSYNYFHLFDR